MSYRALLRVSSQKAFVLVLGVSLLDIAELNSLLALEKSLQLLYVAVVAVVSFFEVLDLEPLVYVELQVFLGHQDEGLFDAAREQQLSLKFHVYLLRLVVAPLPLQLAEARVEVLH